MKITKKRHFWKISLLTVLMSTVAIFTYNCGSKLKYEQENNSPKGHGEYLEEEMDLGLINLFDFATGEQINVKQYLMDNDLSHILLIFGSRWCESCMAESKEVQEGVIGQHAIFQTEQGKHFQIIGVNTDPENKKTEVEKYNAANGLEFIKWSDPRGEIMIANFLPQGLSFGVPFSILLSRNGAVWRITNQESVTVDELMNKVSSSLGLDVVGIPPPGDDDDNPPPPPPPPPPSIPSSGLAFEGSGRLDFVKVQNCKDHTTHKLGTLLTGDYDFIQVIDGECTGACQTNHQQLKSLLTNCSTKAKKTTCNVATLQTKESAFCQQDNVFVGGKEILDTFVTHFDWANERKYGSGLYPEIAQLTGPVILGFDKNGKLVFSHNSMKAAMPANTIKTAMAAVDFGTKAPIGYNYTFYKKDIGNIGLNDLLKGSRFLILNIFAKGCTSCYAELTAWSKTGDLLDVCDSAPDKICKITAADVYEPWPTKNIEQHSAEMVPFLISIGIKIPPIFDPTSSGNTDPEMLARFSDGYLSGKYGPAWDGPLGTVIYDYESKILGAYKSSNAEEDERLKKDVGVLIKKYKAMKKVK